MDNVSLESLLECDPALPPTTAKVTETSRKAAKELTSNLKQLGEKLCRGKSSDYLLVGSSICTGLTDAAIQKIVINRSTVSEDDIIAIGITSRMDCSEIL